MDDATWEQQLDASANAAVAAGVTRTKVHGKRTMAVRGYTVEEQAAIARKVNP